jgi:hypothetical protein
VFTLKPFLLALCMALLTLGAQAQTPWTAWLYTPSDGSVTRVRATGEIVDAYRLPLSQAFNTYGEAAVASASGWFIAYTAFDSTAPAQNRQLFVYDTRADIIRFTYDLSGVTALDFELQPRPTAFDESAQTFAFGLVREGAWELALADLSSDSVKGGGPLLQADSGLAGGLPTVYHVQGERAFFSLFDLDGAPLAEYPLYRWRPTERPELFGVTAHTADLIGAGEWLTPIQDLTVMTMSAATTAQAAPSYNALELRAPASASGERLSLDPALSVARAWWIAGGQQVLVAATDLNTGADVFEVLTRDGESVFQFQLGLADIHATPDGVVGLFDQDGGRGLAYLETLSGAFAASTPYTTTDGQTRLLLVTEN